MSEHELWNELGNLYFKSGSYDQAIHAYTRSIVLDRNSGRPYSNMALAYVRQGRYGEAVTLYQRGIKLLTDDREKAAAWCELGDAYRLIKEYQLATMAYQKADELSLGLSPTDGTENDDEMLLYRKPITEVTMPLMDGEDKSANSANEGLPIPSDPSDDMHHFPEELTPWWFDNQLAPEEVPVAPEERQWFDEWTRDSETDNYTAGTSVTTITNPLDIQEPETEAESFQLANLNQRPPATEMLETEEALSQALVVTPVSEFVAENLTDPEAIRYDLPAELPSVELTSEERAAIQAAIERSKRVLDVNPGNALAWDMLGGQYKALGQYEQAIDSYQKAVSLDPSKAIYYYHLALVYAAVERFDDAIVSFERVIEIDPKHGHAHATLGGYYRKKGRVELADEHIAIARDLLGEDDNEYNRACMEAICGNPDRALTLLEIALKNKQSYVNWARRDPDLDFIRNDPRLNALLAEYATKPAQ